MGTTTPEETREVEKYAIMYPEIKTELEEIEKAMNSYTAEHSIEPPSYLKEKILAKVKNESNTDSSVNEPKLKSITSESPTGNSLFFYGSIAATFLFLISTGFAIYFGVRASKLDGYLDNFSKINSNLTDSIKSIAANTSQMENDLAILKNPNYKVVELKGLKPAPDAKAMVCWSPSEKRFI